MHGNFFRGVVLGSVTAALVLSATAALAGTGVGGVFNLGKPNTVNGATSLSGATSGTQLTVGNTSTGASSHTLQVNGASAAGASLVARNTAGPAASFLSPSNKAPFTVSNSQKVVGLNADLLDGLNASAFLASGGTAANSTLFGGFGTDHFLAASGTAANSTLFGGFPLSTFLASRSAPVASGTTAADSTDATDEGQYASMTTGADGMPLISYYDNTNGGLRVEHCGTIDCTSGNTITTEDSGAGVGEWTSAAIGAGGLPVISYFANGVLKVLRCGNADCTSGGLITPVDNGPSVGYYTSVAIGTDGLAVISYYDAANQDLKVAHCGDIFCGSGDTTTTVDSGGNVGSWTSIAIGADGMPVISYYDATNGALKVAHCGNVDCTAGVSTHAVDTGGGGSFLGVNSSIAIGSDGLPIISYRDPGNFTIKFAHCGNFACTSGNTLTDLSNPDIVGPDTSLTIGPDGLPIASYYDLSANSLQVTHCGNVACSAGDTISTVDGSGHLGSGTGDLTAITIGFDGLPAIAYYDNTNHQLDVAHCSNSFCVPYFRRR